VANRNYVGNNCSFDSAFVGPTPLVDTLKVNLGGEKRRTVCATIPCYVRAPRRHFGLRLSAGSRELLQPKLPPQIVVDERPAWRTEPPTY